MRKKVEDEVVYITMVKEPGGYRRESSKVPVTI